MTMGSHFVPDCFMPMGYMPFPMFMSSAAGWLESVGKEQGIEVFMRDSVTRGESYFRCYQFVRELAPDWIVFESAPSSWESDQSVLAQLAKESPKSKVILTGTITADTAIVSALDWANIVAIVKGEYEKGVEQAITFDGKRLVIERQFLSAEEMNGPHGKWKWDEGCARNYFDENPLGQKAPQLQMWASRGCVYKCNFCAWPATMTNDDPLGTGKRQMRYYTGDYIENYIRERLAVTPDLACVYFDGDTENISDKHTLEICEAMRKIGLPWSMMCRGDTSSREVWKEMKDSGCFGVKIGFESGSQRVVNEIIGKGLDIQEARETAIFLKEIGMTVHGTFMVGHPGETPEEANQTIEFIKKLYADKGLDTHQLSGTATISGTPLANLKAGETNKRYPGAKKDENWHEDLDGQKKAERLVQATHGY